MNKKEYYFYQKDLETMPVDELKIDMSFVREIQEQPMKQAMVSFM